MIMVLKLIYLSFKIRPGLHCGLHNMNEFNPYSAILFFYIWIESFYDIKTFYDLFLEWIWIFNVK